MSKQQRFPGPLGVIDLASVYFTTMARTSKPPPPDDVTIAGIDLSGLGATLLRSPQRCPRKVTRRLLNRAGNFVTTVEACCLEPGHAGPHEYERQET